jgi:hypothetical protein
MASAAEAVALEQVSASIPPSLATWFNLASAKVRAAAKAQAQFEQMIKLVPDEPSPTINRQFLSRRRPYRQAMETKKLRAESLLRAHFQLYNLYRQSRARTMLRRSSWQLFKL